ncbi:MAG: hypothetical protein WBG38_00830 [Nodosilinea sp.]
MQKLHVALSVDDISASVSDYSVRLGCEPVLVIDKAYALWRTETVNLSIRQVGDGTSGSLRHLGWEDDQAETSTAEVDVNGIVWERFAAHHQADEISEIWPETDYCVKDE